MLYWYWNKILCKKGDINKKMNEYELELIAKSREYQVIKSNQITFGSRYNYSIDEQKTIAYICSLIKPTSHQIELEYNFNIRNFCKTCGIDYNNGKVYEYIRNILRGLVQKVMILELPDGTETTVNWVQKVWSNKGTGIVRIKLDEDMIPYLFELKCRFMSYKLKDILCMKSQYSIRLYEVLKSYHDLKIGQTDHRNKKEKFSNPQIVWWEVNIDELKRKLMVNTIQTYNNYKNFRLRVLEPAQKEINAFTEINIFFKPIYQGRKVIKIEFGIISKDLIERLKADDNANKELRLPK